MKLNQLTNINKVWLMLLLGLGVYTDLLAQSSGQNYVQTRTPRRAITTDAKLDALTLNKDSVQVVIQYLDGLGRPVQTVGVRSSPLGKDLIQPISYDEYGREAVRYLPYVASTATGAYQTTPFASQQSFYNPAGTPSTVTQLPSGVAHIVTPFSQTIFDGSPLNRTVDQGAEGDAWQPYSATSHTVKVAYSLNNNITWVTDQTSSKQVVFYTATILADQSRTLVRNGYYANNELSVTITKDENWVSGRAGTSEEYKDKEGRIVLKRLYNLKAGTTEVLSTYYVYDDFNNLAFVLTPGANPDLASGQPDQTALDNFCYQYRYDGKSRLVEKKLPHKGWDFIVYNKLDQAILTQDAVQRTVNQWLFTKYDVFGRIIITGMTTNSGSRATLQTTANSASVFWEIRDNSNASATGTGYTNGTIPLSALTYYTINYYDNYDFYDNTFGQPNGTSQVTSPGTRSLQTGSRVNVLGTSTMLLTVLYYDKEGRLVRSNSRNHLAGTDVVDNTYSFTSELTTATRTHTVSSVVTTIANRYAYDHMGRRKTSKIGVNGVAQIVLSKLDYNEIGQLSKKSLHSTDSLNYLQNTRYEYNARGWLKKNISNEFNMTLGYDTLSNPQYNGNIVTQQWGSNLANKFLYTYDKMNRLTNGTSTGIVMSEVIDYDVMGNINTFSRDGGAARLYVYTGNRLNHVEWVTNSYFYDGNGNATTDGRNGTTLSYNYLNLLATVTKATPALSITYTYDANGRKLKKVNNTTATTRQYIDGIEYNGSTIDFIHTEEGIARNTSGVYSYEYHLRDHLGNVRYTFNKNATTGLLTKLQEDNYYPFGKQKSVVTGLNKYLYNSKELQTELGQLDYGARFYDPEIARFITVDPLSEISRRNSIYSYALNNPIRFIDVDGMFAASPIYDPMGNFLGTDDEGLKGRAIVMNSKDFSQGMSHEEAKSKSTYERGDADYGFANEKAALKYANHYVNLKNRPDYDGFVTISEGIDWAKQHPGALNNPTPDNALYLDASKLDFGNLSAGDLAEGVKGNINLFNFVDFTNSKSRATTYALGNTQMKLLNAKTGAVKLYSDGYDWDYHDRNYVESARPPSSTRDRLIWGERKRAGLNDSHGFNVYMYGIGNLRK
ncbi:DUF6443 domain-containing protein [Pedobacter psychroterrae]|uniref:RHS repeat-associated core domain-containing protein n=1 Tax=Pedobacter psychroterrae TaxID=2530453 RepID=A0A4R0ND38_9SPHI|nr:DUF6443 domain-containing protein [Pedobacter psychroterrae]TCC96384.1 RHS repeat-associated core domain-containing protein [Pedobacter psychroterrae]